MLQLHSLQKWHKGAGVGQMMMPPWLLRGLLIKLREWLLSCTTMSDKVLGMVGMGKQPSQRFSHFG